MTVFNQSSSVSNRPQKISPNVYEFHQKDFVPQDDLVVYFYTVSPEVLNQ